MTAEEHSRLSYYKELAPLNAEHGVFLAQHRESGELFVKKVLVNYQINIFRQLQAAPIPQMPRIIEAIEDEGRLIVIETYLSGTTLQHVLDQNGPLPPSQIKDIGIQLCHILSQLHSRHIIHRDIKPSNILISEEGTVKLLDLDAAKVYKVGEREDTRLIGTRGYAAPEQYGFGASSPVTDIYAVGILLNVLATGCFPNERAAADASLNFMIQRCTRMDPTERYQSVYELERALSCLFVPPRTSPNPICYANSPERKPVPGFAPAPFASGAAVAMENTGIKRLIPPGFRTGKIWKKLLALLWDCFIILLAMFLFSEAKQEGAPPLWVLSIAGIWVILLGIGLPAFMCNYLGIWQKLHIDRIRSVFLRYLSAFLCYLLLALLYWGIARVILWAVPY